LLSSGVCIAAFEAWHVNCVLTILLGSASRNRKVSQLTPFPADDEFVQLLARVRNGDEAAVSELVGRYERVVLRAVRSRLGQSMRGAMDSMDVMQSVHRSLLVGLQSDRFEMSSPQQLIALAVLMVQRKVARHWRRLKRLPTTGKESSRHDPPLEAIAGSEAAPAEMASATDLLQQVLSRLGELDRELVRLKLDGHSSADAARILGREPAFVRMRWSRMRQMLRAGGYADG
jgi:RNA polymerase sigma factor (sigma-70 family)